MTATEANSAAVTLAVGEAAARGARRAPRLDVCLMVGGTSARAAGGARWSTKDPRTVTDNEVAGRGAAAGCALGGVDGGAEDSARRADVDGGAVDVERGEPIPGLGGCEEGAGTQDSAEPSVCATSGEVVVSAEDGAVERTATAAVEESTGGGAHKAPWVEACAVVVGATAHGARWSTTAPRTETGDEVWRNRQNRSSFLSKCGGVWPGHNDRQCWSNDSIFAKKKSRRPNPFFFPS